jgi:hypothetical protein
MAEKKVTLKYGRRTVVMFPKNITIENLRRVFNVSFNQLVVGNTNS